MTTHAQVRTDDPTRAAVCCNLEINNSGHGVLTIMSESRMVPLALTRIYTALVWALTSSIASYHRTRLLIRGQDFKKSLKNAVPWGSPLSAKRALKRMMGGHEEFKAFCDAR